MKAQLSGDGVLHLTGETPIENFALLCWKEKLRATEHGKVEVHPAGSGSVDDRHGGVVPPMMPPVGHLEFGGQDAAS